RRPSPVICGKHFAKPVAILPSPPTSSAWGRKSFAAASTRQTPIEPRLGVCLDDRECWRLLTISSGTRRAETMPSVNACRGRPTALQGDGAVVGSQRSRGMVLVVDDDEGVRAVMATALEDDGWAVETAEDGRSA